MKLKKIIALYGASDVGKTTALKIVIDKLRTVSESFKIEDGYDVRAVFKLNKEVIGVCTGGDDESTISDNIDFFISEKCTIAVSATRTKGVGKTLYDDFAKENNLELIRIHKDDDLNSCKAYAEKLYQIIIGKN